MGEYEQIWHNCKKQKVAFFVKGVFILPLIMVVDIIICMSLPVSSDSIGFMISSCLILLVILTIFIGKLGEAKSLTRYFDNCRGIKREVQYCKLDDFLLGREKNIKQDLAINKELCSENEEISKIFNQLTLPQQAELLQNKNTSVNFFTVAEQISVSRDEIAKRCILNDFGIYSLTINGKYVRID